MELGRSNCVRTLPRWAACTAVYILIVGVFPCSCSRESCDTRVSPALKSPPSQSPLNEPANHSDPSDLEQEIPFQLTPDGEDVLEQLMCYGDSYEERLATVRRLQIAATDETSTESLEILNAYVWSCTVEDSVLVETLWALSEVGNDHSEAAIRRLLSGGTGPQAPWSSRTWLAAGYALEALQQRRASSQNSNAPVNSNED